MTNDVFSLTGADLDRVTPLISQRAEATPFGRQQVAATRLSKYRNAAEQENSKDYRLYGWCRIDSDLDSVLGVFRWPNLPYLTVIDWINSPRLTRRQTLSGLDRIIEFIFHEMLLEQRFDIFFVSRPRPKLLERYVRCQQFGSERFVPALGKFDISLETIVPARSTPLYRTHAEIIGEVPARTDLWIRRASVKAEYRIPVLIKK